MTGCSLQPDSVYAGPSVIERTIGESDSRGFRFSGDLVTRPGGAVSSLPFQHRLPAAEDYQGPSGRRKTDSPSPGRNKNGNK